MDVIRIDEVNRHKIHSNISIYTKIIYENFIELTQFSNVKHTPQDIYALLESENMVGYVIIYAKKIIGYLFGEYTSLNDGRNVYYLSYIYIAPKYRKAQLGTKLLIKLINMCNHRGTKFIILTCDSQDKKVMNFYKKFGFINDPVLKRSDRYMVMCLYL